MSVQTIGSYILFCFVTLMFMPLEATTSLTDRFNEYLKESVFEGNAEGVRSALRGGADPNLILNDHYERPLHVASRQGDVEVVRALLEEAVSIDVNTYTQFGDRPLHLAATQESIELIELLLNFRGINKNAKNLSGATPLHMAIENTNEAQRRAIVQLFLSKGCNPNVMDNSRETTLHIAAYIAESEGIVEDLLKAGAKLSKNKIGEDPIDIARNQRHKKTVSLLELSFIVLDFEIRGMKKLCLF